MLKNVFLFIKRSTHKNNRTIKILRIKKYKLTGKYSNDIIVIIVQARNMGESSFQL
jgi:hypothetical protein